MTSLSHEDFGKLLEFRVALRRFQRWSEQQARAFGLTHAQHQLLLAIEGHQESRPPAVGDLARYLLLRPHSTVELIDRAALAGLVQRVPDPIDGRIVRVRLTGEGDRVVRSLTPGHLEQLQVLAVALDELLNRRDDRVAG